MQNNVSIQIGRVTLHITVTWGPNLKAVLFPHVVPGTVAGNMANCRMAFKIMFGN